MLFPEHLAQLRNLANYLVPSPELWHYVYTTGPSGTCKGVHLWSVASGRRTLLSRSNLWFPKPIPLLKLLLLYLLNIKKTFQDDFKAELASVSKSMLSLCSMVLTLKTQKIYQQLNLLKICVLVAKRHLFIHSFNKPVLSALFARLLPPAPRKNKSKKNKNLAFKTQVVSSVRNLCSKYWYYSTDL